MRILSKAKKGSFSQNPLYSIFTKEGRAEGRKAVKEYEVWEKKNPKGKTFRSKALGKYKKKKK